MSRLFASDNFRSPREIWIEFMRAMSRHKWLVLSVQIITVLSAYGYLQLMTERYQADTQLLVKLGRQNVDGPLSAARGTVTTMGVREEEINSHISLLSSQSLVEETVDEIGEAAFDTTLPEPKTFAQAIKYYVKSSVRWVKRQYQEALIAANIEKRLTPRQAAVVYCHQNLNVERVKSSDVIQVRMWLPNPDFAIRFEETLIRRYLARHVRARAAEVSEDFFAAQADSFRKQVDDLDRQLVALTDESQLALIDRQRELLLARLHDMYEDRDECRNELELLKASQASRRDASTPLEQREPQDPAKAPTSASTSDASVAISPPPSEDTVELIPSRTQSLLKDRIIALHLDKSHAISVDGGGSPKIKAIDKEIRLSESQMERGLVARIAQYDERTAAIESRLEELNQGEVRANALTRERDVAERNYLSYAGRREDSRISRELDRDNVANVSVLTPPVATPQPVYPKKKTIALVSIVAGLLLGIGLALTLEYFDDTIRGSRDITAIEGWQVLGQVRIGSAPGRPIARMTPPRRPSPQPAAGR